MLGTLRRARTLDGERRDARAGERHAARDRLAHAAPRALDRFAQRRAVAPGTRRSSRPAGRRCRAARAPMRGDANARARSPSASTSTASPARWPPLTSAAPRAERDERAGRVVHRRDVAQLALEQRAGLGQVRRDQRRARQQRVAQRAAGRVVGQRVAAARGEHRIDARPARRDSAASPAATASHRVGREQRADVERADVRPSRSAANWAAIVAGVERGARPARRPRSCALTPATTQTGRTAVGGEREQREAPARRMPAGASCRPCRRRSRRAHAPALDQRAGGGLGVVARSAPRSPPPSPRRSRARGRSWPGRCRRSPRTAAAVAVDDRADAAHADRQAGVALRAGGEDRADADVVDQRRIGGARFLRRAAREADDRAAQRARTGRDRARPRLPGRGGRRRRAAPARTSSLTSAMPPAARTRPTIAISVAPSMPALARIWTSRMPPRSMASVKAIGSAAAGSISA